MLMVWMASFVLCRLYAGGQDGTWISFVDEIGKYHDDNTNRVYYAGSSNDVAFLYHQTSNGIREWQINNTPLLDTVRRPFSRDNKRWVIIKADIDEKISCLNIKAMAHDFIKRLPSESALVNATDELFMTDRGYQYEDGTPVLICRREYKVIASYSAKLHKGDIVCTSWLVDDYTSTTNILSNSKGHQRHSIVDERTLYVTWNSEMLSQGKINRYFYIGDVVATTIEFVWDCDINHAALVPFDEEMVIDMYIVESEKRRRPDTHIADKEQDTRCGISGVDPIGLVKVVE